MPSPTWAATTHSRPEGRVWGVQPALEDACATSRTPGAGSVLRLRALFTEIVGTDQSYYYVYGQFAPQKAVFLNDFDFYNVGLLAPSSTAERLLHRSRTRILVCRPDFEPRGLCDGSSRRVSQELAGQAGGPKVRLADIPTRGSR